jgi:virginiamycin B lyase
VREYPTGSGELPLGITTGPDGNVWFTEELGNNIVRLVPGDPPTMTEYPLLTQAALPFDITRGLDGNLWFTELYGRHIGKITPEGHITEYYVPAALGIGGIAAGADGRLWFTENDGAKVGSISANGVLGRRFDSGVYPFGITRGPSLDVWFCTFLGNTIGRVHPPAA